MPPPSAGIVPVADILANVDQRLARENGRIDVLMLSGGEPTLHPQLPELLDALVSRNIVRILLNTNGLLIAKDDGLLALLRRHRERVEVNLQFDGLRIESSRHHRGGDFRGTKEAVVRRLCEAEVFTTLTMTAALGVNDDEIGDVIRLALDTPFVSGVSIQPVFGSGRANGPGSRSTDSRTPGTLGAPRGADGRRGRPGAISRRCPARIRTAARVGYLLQVRRRASGARSSRSSATTRLKENLGLVANRFADPEIPEQLREAVRSSRCSDCSASRRRRRTRTSCRLWRDVCATCDLGISLAGEARGERGLARAARTDCGRMLAERVVRITVKPFMDRHTMIEERLTQCCVHVGTRAAGSGPVRAVLRGAGLASSGGAAPVSLRRHAVKGGSSS